jgi:hypothetical protein
MESTMTPDEIDPTTTYDDATHATFAQESAAAGLKVTHYEGRYFYSGPAVQCDDFQALVRVIRATTVRIQWDELGKYGFVIYPA